MPRRDEPHPMGQAVARRIAKLRAEQGMSLERLAFQSGVAKGHLSNVERGLAVVTIVTLDRIARGLGIEVYYLLIFPEKGTLDRCIERLRTLEESELKEILARYPPQRKARRPPVARRHRVTSPQRD